MAFSRLSSARGLAFVVALGVASTVVAQTKPIHVAHRFSMTAPPVKGVVVLTSGDRILTAVPGVFIPRDGGGYTLVAEGMVPDSVDDVAALVTAISKTGEVFNAVVQPSSPEFSFDMNRLKTWGSDKKAELKTLEAEEQNLRGQLQQLEKRGGRQVTGGRSESGTGGDLADVATSLKLAQARMATLNAVALPPNYKRREAELSAYLNVLSTELKLARDGGGGVLSDASREALDKRALVESTKDEHIDLLEDELARLRRQREEAERNR